MRKDWKAIAAMSENRVIGKDNTLPWDLPEELNWFRQSTMGGVVVMGRKTWESILRPMPKRLNIVVSRTMEAKPDFENVVLVRSLDEIDELDIPAERPIWIIGGQQVYKEAMPRCAEVYLTQVHRRVEAGDAFFPEFEEGFEVAEVIRETPEFTINRWVRK